MKLSRFAVPLLAMALAVPAFAQTQTPATSQRGTTPPPATTQAGRLAAPSSSTSQGKLVDINTASATELDALPGIGKARAEAIIKNRPYRAKDDLVGRHIIPQNVFDGIKDKIIARRS